LFIAIVAVAARCASGSAAATAEPWPIYRATATTTATNISRRIGVIYSGVEAKRNSSASCIAIPWASSLSVGSSATHTSYVAKVHNLYSVTCSAASQC
jgi:hypothetical protein